MLLDSKKIEQDGSIIDSIRDAPGQESIYIPPGHHESETYRRATFSKYPKEVPVNVILLAQVGFYYTGYRDRVKCFSCGIAVENWMTGDDVTEKRWHRFGCFMSMGEEPRNISLTSPLYGSFSRNMEAASHRTTQAYTGDFHESPPAPATILPELKLANIENNSHQLFLLNLNLTKESDRRKSFKKWPTYPAPLLPESLAKDGFFYLGNLDRVQCFSCSGVLRNWGPGDDIRTQHRQHFPHCLIVNGQEKRNREMSTEGRKQLEHESTVSNLSRLRSSHFSRKELQERYPCKEPCNPYMENEKRRRETFDNRWPSHTIKASVEEIAQAGFFFLGERDRTKCFYCNGGLQNWESDDDPWREHAKWFPGCEYVLATRGPEFVGHLVEEHPNLNRPSIPNPVSYEVPPTGTSSANELNELLRNLEFEKDKTEDAIREKKQTPCSSKEKDAPINTANTSLLGTKGADELNEHEKIKQELDKINMSGMCKICFVNKADTMFTPCGHLAACSKCALAVRRCMLCMSKVENVLKVFRC